MEPRLKTHIWVAAYLRRLASANIPVYVVHKGDETSGSVLVKVDLRDGRARIFQAIYDDKGERVWAPALKDDPAALQDADAYATRALSRDPDLWLIEIEERAGDPHLEGL